MDLEKKKNTKNITHKTLGILSKRTLECSYDIPIKPTKENE